ncbi:TPA: AAA family ATPase, partial [Acinetobacter baumannii]
LTNNFFMAGKEQQEPILETSLIFGANGSGKTNFIATLAYLKRIALNQNPENKFIAPFRLNNDSKKTPSELEIEFYAKNNIKYRYGISIFKGEIIEEWLYYTPQTRETILFHREKNSLIEYNSAGFIEAKDFIDENQKISDKLKNDTAFIFLLSTFNGEHSNAISEWFSNIVILDIEDKKDNLKDTLYYWKDNNDFQNWARPILNSLGICDLKFDHKVESVEDIVKQIKSDQEKLKNSNEKNKELKDKAINLFDNLLDFVTSSSLEKTEDIDFNSVKVIKNIDGNEFPIPLYLESSGTIKLIHLLSALYRSSKNGEILLIDEFDVKFHTLLSKYIFKKYHDINNKGQVIVTVHDTNLMDTNYFRRDQIWLINKNPKGESELYSLIEFKELASNINNKNYSTEYLTGFFHAIPLFNEDDVDSLMEDNSNG